MTGETRVSLVVGLLFIILFGLIISRLTETKTPTGARGGQTASGAPSADGMRPGIARDIPTPPMPGDSEAPTTVPTVTPPSTPAQVTPPPAPAALRPAAVPAAGEVRKHTVKSGETISRIAGAYYGPGNAGRGAELILKANADRVASASKLRVNTELTIPPLP